VLDRCEQLRAETRGYFDARAGGALDPSGLVKAGRRSACSP
jgi:thiamine biosynthesis lipoprotein